MLSKNVTQKIRQLSNEGHSDSYISRELKISYPTVRKYLRLTNDFDQKAIISPSFTSPMLVPFENKINEYINAGISSSKKIEQLIRKNGCTGSYQLLNTYVRRKREEKIAEKADSYFRVETAPGEQAQVDWGYFGKVGIGGDRVGIFAFVFVLSNSRALYAEFVMNQKQKTLQTCHLNAFSYLGGIPRKIRYDNMKTVVTDREKIGNVKYVHLNLEFQNFAHYYGFEPEVCPPYYPRSKGKVEAAVKFLRVNFFNGEKFNKTFFTVEELNKKLLVWLNEYANVRKHPIISESVGTLWQQEKQALHPFDGAKDFLLASPQIRRVSKISMVSYKRASYWVPKQYIQHKVEIREKQEHGRTILEFYAKEGKIAEYPMAAAGSWILPDERELIKTRDARGNIERRIKSNPAYSMQIQARSLDDYARLIDEPHYGSKENS